MNVFIMRALQIVNGERRPSAIMGVFSSEELLLGDFPTNIDWDGWIENEEYTNPIRSNYGIGAVKDENNCVIFMMEEWTVNLTPTLRPGVEL